MNDFLINVISSKLKEFAELNADKKKFCVKPNVSNFKIIKLFHAGNSKLK